MESRYFEYFTDSAPDFSYSYSNTSSVSSRLFESLKFGSTHLEARAITGFIDSQENNLSSTNNLSEATPSSNSSSLGHNQSNFLQQPTACRQGSIYTCSDAVPSFFPNPSHHSVTHALWKLETALMTPCDEEEVATSDPFLGENKRSEETGSSSRAWNQEGQGSHSRRSESPTDSRYVRPSNQTIHFQRQKEFDSSALQSDPPNNLKQLLIACAEALSENRLTEFEKLIGHARSAVSLSGEPIQRLGAYMIEGLVARKELSGSNIYRALKCHEPMPDSRDLLSYMQILYEICPYLKFGYMAANGAIAEACKNEDSIHIIDFQIAQGTQWMTLLQALAARPGGAPRVRITGIDDPMSEYARGAGLAAVGRRLAAISEKFKIPVEFHAVPVFAPDITIEMLGVRPHEALAVNFPLQLHHTPDESVDVTNPRDGLLRMVKSLRPKVVTLVEQESNTNTAPFVPRFVEALEYYSAMFESIDVTMPRDRKERINVEQHCLARDIVNIIACEGKERVERHELLGKWRLRFMMAGFRPFPLNSYVNSVIRGLLKCYSEHYTLTERDGAMLLGWKDRNLVSASAWSWN